MLACVAYVYRTQETEKMFMCYPQLRMRRPPSDAGAHPDEGLDRVLRVKDEVGVEHDRLGREEDDDRAPSKGKVAAL